MGNWRIVIKGSWAHPGLNYGGKDDQLLVGFIDQLRSAGHDISSAVFYTDCDPARFPPVDAEPCEQRPETD